MAVFTQTILDSIADVTKDVDRQRWTLPEIARWLNQTASIIARVNDRATAGYYTLTLAAGVRQDLRTIDAAKKWQTLHALVCNATGAGEATGDAIFEVPRSALDSVFRTWRSTAPTATKVKEYALDPRVPLTFDVNPPVAAGVKIVALASVIPAPFCVLNGDGTGLQDTSEVIPLADGFDVPLLDGTLHRMFSKDANDPTYVSRAAMHLQLFQLGLGVVPQAAAGQ